MAIHNTGFLKNQLQYIPAGSITSLSEFLNSHQDNTESAVRQVYNCILVCYNMLGIEIIP